MAQDPQNQKRKLKKQQLQKIMRHPIRQATSPDQATVSFALQRRLAVRTPQLQSASSPLLGGLPGHKWRRRHANTASVKAERRSPPQMDEWCIIWGVPWEITPGIPLRIGIFLLEYFFWNIFPCRYAIPHRGACRGIIV